MVRFGPFEFDPAEHRLRSGGADVHLAPKAFELLSILIAAAPRVVAKAELHERLWPRGVVSDATLIGLIKELRRALDDHDPSARLIRTVHRVGYAFEAPLEPAEAIRSRVVAHWLVAESRRLPLAQGENIVGRDARSEVWVDHTTVSRRHARIVVAGEDVHVEDLDSKNGTTVGGVRVAESIKLRDGDPLQFGLVRLVYRRGGAGPATETHVGKDDSAARPRGTTP